MIGGALRRGNTIFLQVSEQHDHPRVVDTVVVPLTNNTMKAVVHIQQREGNACERRDSTVRTAEVNAKIEEGTYEHRRPCPIIVLVTIGETSLSQLYE